MTPKLKDCDMVAEILNAMGEGYFVSESVGADGSSSWICNDKRGKLVFKSKTLLSLRRNVLNKLKGKNK